MGTDKNDKATRWAVAWAAYDHNARRRDALYCGFLGVYATKEAAEKGVMNTIAADVSVLFEDYDGEEDLPEGWRGRTPVDLADEWTHWGDWRRGATVEFDDGREFRYSLTPLSDIGNN